VSSAGSRPRVVTAGETMALLLPQAVGRLRHAPTVDIRIGGAESNVAIALARLGVPSGWVSWLGNDALGDLVLSRLRAEGVDTCQVRRIDAPTGLYVRERLPNQTRVYYHRNGSAASMMGPMAFDPEYLDGASYLHLSGITAAISQAGQAFVSWVISEGRRRDVRISFDVNFRTRLWEADRARDFVESLLPEVDVLFVGSDEADALWGESGRDLVSELRRGGPSEVILKLGADGSLGCFDGDWQSRPAIDVEVVDSVGAGDAFAAGYLAASLWGLEPGQRLEIGNAMGAYSTLSLGDYEGLPTREELESFMSGALATFR